MSQSRKELESSLNKLSLSSKSTKTPSKSSKPSKKPKAIVADSWEDDTSSGSDTDRPLTAQSSTDYPPPPPPTPISPTSPFSRNDADRFASPYADWSSSSTNGSSGSPVRNSERRPEKTDAVAKRMIAGALGVRAPKKTEEARQYERAVKDREKKRIDGEREAKRREEDEVERARKAAWED